MSTRDFRTRFAMQAADVAELFGTAFGHLRISPAGYAPQLIAPEGPSTGGGKQVVQHLRLVPSDGTLSTLVIGSVNLKLQTAELRTYEHVDVIHQARFNAPVVLDRAAYDAFLDSATKYFTAMKVATTRTAPPAGGARSLRSVRPTTVPFALLFAVGLLAAVTAIFAAVHFHLFTHR